MMSSWYRFTTKEKSHDGHVHRIFAGAATITPGVMIRYKVRREQVKRNLELLRAFYEELESAQPSGLRYASFQLEDKVSFVDFAVGVDLPAPLPRLKSFGRFRTTLEDRCDEPPVMTELHEVGSFRSS